MNFREAALSIPCRHRHCHAVAGQKCLARHSRREQPYFHQVRGRDAHRMLNDRAKLADWNQRYGEKEN